MAKQNSRRNDEPRDREPDTTGNSGQWGDPTDPPVVEVSFEELLELQDEMEGDDTLGDIIDTAHTDGSTNNVQMAMDQGLVWDPPLDPPVVPSDDLQNVEIAAGFGSGIGVGDDDWGIEDFPDQVDDNDSDLEEDLRVALRHNSETSHLENVRIYVRNGIVFLRGTVLDDDDLSIVEEFIRDNDAVRDIRNELEVAD
jgi:hypothetical protein